MSTDETHIVVDWVQPVQAEKQTDNTLVVVKQTKSKMWKVTEIVTAFLGGLFTGLVSAYFIYNY
jgi:hypothetical protein